MKNKKSTTDKPSAKERIDKLVFERGFSDSREKAASLIMAGLVIVNEQRVDKPGTKVNIDSDIRLKKQLPYVSRGGYKLEKAFEIFDIAFFKDSSEENSGAGRVVIDIGSSTGGFTDVCLKHGASKVFAVDVGLGLLHSSLVQDSRVIAVEKTNFRHIQFETIGEAADLIVSDVSFISLTKIIPALIQFCKSETKIVFLIKPQFEAGRENIGKKGIVKDKEIHADCLIKIIEFALDKGLYFSGLCKSPITGAKGNEEFLACFYAKNTVKQKVTIENIVEKVIYENYCYSCKER